MADFDAPLPVVRLFGGGYLQFEAVSPVDGSAVSGVQVTATSIQAVDLSDTSADVTPDQTPNPTGAYLPGA